MLRTEFTTPNVQKVQATAQVAGRYEQLYFASLGNTEAPVLSGVSVYLEYGKIVSIMTVDDIDNIPKDLDIVPEYAYTYERERIVGALKALKEELGYNASAEDIAAIDSVISGRLSQNNLNSIYSPKANTVGVLGDSITDFGSNTSSIYDGKNVKGYWVWTLAKLNQRLKLIKDGGVASDSTTQIKARLNAYLSPKAPAWNFVMAGTNDAAGLVALSTITGNLTDIYNSIEAAGGRVVALTIPPRTGANAAVNTRINEVNHWIRRQGATRPGLIVVDAAAKLVTPTGVAYKTGLSTDGTHPSPEGAAIIGLAVAEVLDPIIPKIGVLPGTSNDGVNLVTNAFLTGTAGTANVGGTGQVADGWLVSAVDGVASTFTCSKVARTDGVSGEWQQVAVASGQVKAHWHVNYASGAGYAFGDRVYAICEFETDDDFAQGNATASNFFRLRMAATKPDFGDGFAGVDFDLAADTMAASSPYILRKGVLVTPVITVPNTATLRLAFELQRRGVGTFRFSRAGIYKEGTGPLY